MIIAGIISQGELKVENINPLHIQQPIELIRQCGAKFEIFEDSLFLKGPDTILPISFETNPYPGIPTDIQAQLMVLNTIAHGDSKIRRPFLRIDLCIYWSSKEWAPILELMEILQL